MRKAYHGSSILIEEKTFIGVSLGFDFCAEHEWGVDGIIKSFGINKNKFGVDGRKITKGDVIFCQNKDCCLLTSQEPFNKKSTYTVEELLPQDMSFQSSENLICAWDSNNFCVCTKNKEYFDYIFDLFTAFKEKNIIIAFYKQSSNPFSSNSLSILIADRVPKKDKDEMYHVDKKYNDLIKYEHKIGLKKLKEKAKKSSGLYGNHYFMVCSPRWIDYENPQNLKILQETLKTKYKIQYWVNYSDGDDNYGWYTVEQIKEWLSTPGLKLKSLNKQQTL